jgi:hypothetical protein
MAEQSGLLDPLFHYMPLWLLGLTWLVVCLIAREAGVLLYRLRKVRHRASGDNTLAAQAHIVGAIFGLLAFVIGLTFSIALERFDARRALVLEEANAISTAYLRASLLDDRDRVLVQQTLRDYAKTRVAPEGLWDQGAEGKMKQSIALRTRLWEQTRTAVLPVRETDMASYFVEAVNDVLNVGTRREVAARVHIPARIMDVLFIYIAVAAMVLGYMMGEHPAGNREASAILLLLFSMMIVTIVDLDRPQAGALRVPQVALEELSATLQRDAPSAHSGEPSPP